MYLLRVDCALVIVVAAFTDLPCGFLTASPQSEQVGAVTPFHR